MIAEIMEDLINEKKDLGGFERCLGAFCAIAALAAAMMGTAATSIGPRRRCRAVLEMRQAAALKEPGFERPATVRSEEAAAASTCRSVFTNTSLIVMYS